MKHGMRLVKWGLPISVPRGALTPGGLTTNLLGVDRVSKRICSHPDCAKPPEKRGFCDTHYVAAKSNGLIDTGRTCSVDGCETTHYAKGYCAKHYGQAKSRGEFGYKPCGEDGCPRPVKAKGRCSWHYRKARMAGEFGPVPTCKEPDCEKAVEARGYCTNHFRSAAYAGKFKTAKSCTVEACDRNHYGHGLCAAHYARVQRGDDDLTTPIRDEEALYESSEAFLQHTQWNGECLEWTGDKNPRGYGKMWDGRGKVLAYRWWYERTRGPVPEGMELDHWCRNPACVNPEHLRVCTHKENLENLPNEGRGRSGVRGVAWSSQKGKWYARATHNGREHHGGFFDTVEEAATAVRALRNRLHTHNILDRHP